MIVTTFQPEFPLNCREIFSDVKKQYERCLETHLDQIPHFQLSLSLYSCLKHYSH